MSFGRDFVFKKAKEQVDKSTRGKYPAAYEILSCVEKGLGKPPSQAFEFEADAFVRLAKTNESSALIGLFDGITAAKKNPYPTTTKPSSVAVLGAGLMGAGIAQVSAEKGLAVALKDVSPEGLAKGVAYVAGNLDKKVKRRRMDAFKRNTIVSSITGYHDSDGGNAEAFVKKASELDVVIEVPIYLCGNQISGAPRHLHDIGSVAASPRWRRGSQNSPIDFHAGGVREPGAET